MRFGILLIGMPTHIRSQRFEEFGDIEMKPEEVSLTIQYTNFKQNMYQGLHILGGF